MTPKSNVSSRRLFGREAFMRQRAPAVQMEAVLSDVLNVPEHSRAAW